MKDKEQRRKNLPKLGRQRWNSSELADRDPISPSNVRERSSDGGVKGRDDGRRRAPAPA
jgi:hypothetical protein